MHEDVTMYLDAESASLLTRPPEDGRG
jgi:hypothetical protein